jgi:uncharacterized membrane protein YvlD (DUF360 family)
MIRFFIRTAIYFAAALIGIILADIFLSGFNVSGFFSYVSVALIFGLIQAVLQPLLGQVSERNAPMLTGGIGIISAFVALGITNLISGALTIDGVGTWLAAAVLVWIGGAIAAFVLPLIFVKNRVEERRS